MLAAGLAAAQTGPVDVGRVERVEVRYALVDLLVLDARDRTVPGLGATDFELFVDGEPVPVVSVDESCAAGAQPDPRNGSGPMPSVGGPSAGGPARFVHVFDYPHLEHPTEVITVAREALERLGRDDDEHVVAAFAPGLRIESPPARGTGDALRALGRMETDRTLYDGAYARLTERGFFRSLGTLLDVLEMWSGAKVVLLYSGPFLVDGFHHDATHRDVAARAARARVVLYTIDAAGLRDPKGFRYGDLGGPPTLARLAVETGGRLTRNTNDLGLAYARAQRDLACRYTLGFYERAEDPDRPRRLTIRTTRPGARVVHPEAYVPRSNDERRDARIAGALAAPELFPRGGLVLEAAPTGAAGFRLALRLPESWGRSDRAGWIVDCRVVRRTGVVEYETRTPLTAEGPLVDLGSASDLAPRTYRAIAVVSRAESQTPFAVSIDVDVPSAREAQPRGSDKP